MGRRYTTEERADFKNAVRNILLLNAVGRRNAKNFAFFIRELRARGFTPCRQTLLRAFDELSPVGFASGIYGGYFLIPTEAEAREVIADLRGRAEELNGSASKIAEAFGIKNE